ncbi:C40 family peptidase [Alkalicoccus daliensis]|uniref:Cell wall-associated hydrolase, NlpC family n=1 Tax=Alkalicoccus daliensis TaxID=745820 RepID=A0A1H0E0W4_9BACI|nr:C40 family peptidase [Alkalicoccus daliensis]SDN76015.1 Cell wall-associated hydrolase, NlpC family [Alkalicoccus daliensis]
MAENQKRSLGLFWIIALLAGGGAAFLLFSDSFTEQEEQNNSRSPESAEEESMEPHSQGILKTNLDFTIEDFAAEARNLEGAPFSSGGNHPDEGFNTSGFVQYVYEEATGIRMPRISAHQYDLGEDVGREYLQMGDVVFFQAETLMSGIYMEDDEFMTATESDGVITLNLEEDAFWNDNYIGAKRLEENEIESLHPGTYSDHENPVVREAMNYLGTPYEFGGDTLEAFDCSYFIQEVFREHKDVYLPRVTLNQFEVGEDIEEDDIRPGDVLYFSDIDAADDMREDGEVTHAGIYVGNNFMIHASRTEEMTQISFLNDYWSENFTGAKRFDDMTLDGAAPAVEEAASHLNIPYASGGNHPEEGFNPIGFVSYVYEKAGTGTLPSTAEQLWESGNAVEKENLQPEDIVFFDGETNLLPGIYAGHDLFIIATPSSGITIRHLEYSDYFSDLYIGARRF